MWKLALDVCRGNFKKICIFLYLRVIVNAFTLEAPIEPNRRKLSFDAVGVTFWGFVPSPKRDEKLRRRAQLAKANFRSTLSNRRSIFWCIQERQSGLYTMNKNYKNDQKWNSHHNKQRILHCEAILLQRRGQELVHRFRRCLDQPMSSLPHRTASRQQSGSVSSLVAPNI